MAMSTTVEEDLLEDYFKYTGDWRAGAAVTLVDTRSTPGYWEFILIDAIYDPDKEDLIVKESDLLCYLFSKIRDIGGVDK